MSRFGNSRIYQPAGVISTGGGGGSPTSCPPTFIYNETPKRGDAFSGSTVRFTDVERRADQIVFNKLLENEGSSRVDAYRIPTLTVKPAETIYRKNEVGAFSFRYQTRPRSGSPDSDDWGDAFTDATVGSTGTNHGNESPINAVQATSITERRIYIEANFTRFSGMSANGSSTFSLFIANSSVLLATNITLFFGAQTSRPFIESTITQSNQPALPSLFSFPQAVTNTDSRYTFTLSASQVDQLLGKWVLIAIQAANLGVGNNFVVSREGADSTQQMYFDLNIKV